MSIHRMSLGKAFRPVSLIAFCLASFFSNSVWADKIFSDRVSWRGDSAQIQLEESGTPVWDPLRTYRLRTTAHLRDNDPPAREILFSERPSLPILRSGHLIFDGLFALALAEAEQARAPGNQLLDPSFNWGNGVDCACFETGEKWKYVWTRDTAYSVELGLGLTHPQVSKNSLEFKLSDKRADVETPYLTGPEIVQDTGSGGGWPVSTDRVVWALGASELLESLEGVERERFRDRAYTALVNTLETDREAIFDETDGLYRGEKSFLDWREQTYPSWTVQKTVPIGMSKALSTNVVIYQALRIAAQIAFEKEDSLRGKKFEDWAKSLAVAINREFWLPQEGMYSSMKGTSLQPVAVKKFDLLGQSLAILFEIADEERARLILARYPHTVAGAAVVWPQLQNVPIYHNRAIWPFVTAYWLRAAKKAKNGRVFDHNLESLIRGAALNLSHMENFEFTTLSSEFADGALSGPVLNSKRQLWSVAGYLSMVMKGIFGIEVAEGMLRFDPFLTQYLRETYFSDTDRVTLKNFVLRGKKIDIDLFFPHKGSETLGCYEAEALLLNSKKHQGLSVAYSDLGKDNIVEIRLKSSACDTASIRLFETEALVSKSRKIFESLFSPREPILTSLSQEDGSLVLSYDSRHEHNITFNIYKNGVQVESGVDQTYWVDSHFDPKGLLPSCYSVESVYRSSLNTSHLSEPSCHWPRGSLREFTVQSGGLISLDQAHQDGSHGRLHFDNWGRPQQVLETTDFSVKVDGTYFGEVIYGNGFGPINTGVTAAVKKLEVIEIVSGEVIASDVVMMPHLGRWETWDGSSFARVNLRSGRQYKFRLSEYFNMSYFDHFRAYTASGHDLSQGLNRANISGIKLLKSFN